MTLKSQYCNKALQETLRAVVESVAKNLPKRTEQAQQNFKQRRSIQPSYPTNGDSSALFKADTKLFTIVLFGVFSGTASVALAGLLAAQRAVGKPITEHRVLFLGAGEVRSYLSINQSVWILLVFLCFWAYFSFNSLISKKENRPSCNGHIAPCWPDLVILIINSKPTFLSRTQRSQNMLNINQSFSGEKRGFA